MRVLEKPCSAFRRNRQGQPWILVYHYGATFTAEGTYKALEARKVSAHGTLDLDGTLWRHVDFKDTAWHAGESSWAGTTDVNDDSIGLEIVNIAFGDPIPPGTNTSGWYLAANQKGRALTAFRIETYKATDGTTKKTYVGIAEPMAAFPDHRPAWRGKLWAQYTPAQVEALKEYQRDVVRQFGILPEAIVGHEHIAPGRKSDPGPAFQPVWDALAADYIAFARTTNPQLLDPAFQAPLRMKCLQSHLRRLGVYRLRVDGDAGDKTRQAIVDAITKFGPTYGFANLDPKSTTIDLCHALRRVPGFDSGLR